MVKRIAVTGGGGQIAYSLLFRIASGELFGKNEYIFEKDANELEVSMPNQNIELFISNLEQNKNVVNIQLL